MNAARPPDARTGSTASCEPRVTGNDADVSRYCFAVTTNRYRPGVVSSGTSQRAV